MKLAFLDLCGFRGYRSHVRMEFADAFTVIDGRNGVGKSTLFDAVEFALTGTITRPGSAKSDGESITDYLWYSAPGAAPSSRHVEVGFRSPDGTTFTVRRTATGGNVAAEVERLLPLLCDESSRPAEPLKQLCDVSIIRDERIAQLSLDLKEAERYALIRDAIGAPDSARWLDRGSRLLTKAKQRVQGATLRASELRHDVESTQRRIDEIRTSQLDSEVVAAAARRLQFLLSTSAAADELVEPAREYLAELSMKLETFDRIALAWDAAERARLELPELERELGSLRELISSLTASLTALTARVEERSASSLSKVARDLAALLALGRQSGLIEGGCPLCAHKQDLVQFGAGIASMEARIDQLDREAIALSALQAEREQVNARLATAAEQERALVGQLATHSGAFETLFALMGEIGANGQMLPLGDIEKMKAELIESMSSVKEDLRVLETLKLSAALERALIEEQKAREAYADAERRLGVARRGEARAQALYDAVRRATGESVDQRIERVLPLLGELYRRLRPHPTWDTLEYKVRGDVRRFMKLSVGEEQNPQFMFSSGQRRATGLAFLLSVNLSLAWSRWRSVLLDDPVQHIDDFRSIQLTEVLSQIVLSGRQVICAVEDEALADMMCRRLPVLSAGAGKRVSLGPGTDGDLAILKEERLTPLMYPAFIQPHESQAG